MRTARLTIALLAVLAWVQPAAASALRVFTLAGSGSQTFGGDGRLATDAGGEFRDVAALAHGGLLVSGAGAVRRVDAHGVITTVAGRGSFNQFAPLGDGGPATSASLDPAGLAVLPGGGFLVADPGHASVRMVSARGAISTVAGGGGADLGSSLGPLAPKGDRGPATSATLERPVAVAALPSGGFLIADAGENRVRMVDAHGVITTVAGTGEARSGGDGGPATAAGLDEPSAVAVLADGGFLVAEAGGGRVRRVDADGVITTVAGDGRDGGGGYPGPAARAQLDEPRGLLVWRGGFLIAEAGRVRRVDARGRITTLAGTPPERRAGGATFAVGLARTRWSGLSEGIGGAALDAWLVPLSLAGEPDGSVLVGAYRHVLVLTAGRRPPLAVALRPPSVSAGRLRLEVAASEPGQERVVVRTAHGGRRVASLARSVRAGVTDLAIGAPPSGELVVRVTLRGHGRVATDETAIVTGPVLATRLARAAIASYCCEGPAAVTATPHARPSREEPYIFPSVSSCHRFTRTRVDCRWAWRGECLGSASARLRGALVYLETTESCAFQRRVRRHSRPWIVPLL